MTQIEYPEDAVGEQFLGRAYADYEIAKKEGSDIELKKLKQ